MAQIPEAGVPLRVKYPDGNIRTRRFQLTDSIQVKFLQFCCNCDTGCECNADCPWFKLNYGIPFNVIVQVLFDFIGEEEDATEYFHVQDASTLRTLKSNMCGTLLQNNIGGSCTLYVHWIYTDDPEVRDGIQI